MKKFEKEKAFKELKPDHVLENVVMRRDELENMILLVQRRLDVAPKGSLRVSYSGKKNHQFYYCQTPGDSHGKYIKKSHEAVIPELAQKEYDKKLLCELQKKIAAIDSFIEEYRPDYLEEIYEGMHKQKQKYIAPVYMNTDAYVKRWKSVIYEGNTKYEMDKEYKTDAGDMVRSKSEIVIANKLFALGVPYRYEYPLTFQSGKTIYPDFCCLNKRTREEIIWEHLGMMDIEEYANSAIRKIEEYEKNGYWLGKKLILTFETASKPVNVSIIEKNIQQYLI